MSFVGPRPEVRHYVNYWTPEQMHVLMFVQVSQTLLVLSFAMRTN